MYLESFIGDEKFLNEQRLIMEQLQKENDKSSSITTAAHQPAKTLMPPGGGVGTGVEVRIEDALINSISMIDINNDGQKRLV